MPQWTMHILTASLHAGAAAIVSAGVRRVPLCPEANRTRLAGGGERAAAAGNAGAGSGGRREQQMTACWQRAAVGSTQV